MTPIKTMPDLPWTEQSAKEIAAAGKDLAAASDFAWQVGDLFVAGWYYPALAGPPWFWFALTTNFERRHIRVLNELRPAIPAGATTAVDKDFIAGLRFAQFYGFKPTGETQQDGQYLVYRRD